MTSDPEVVTLRPGVLRISGFQIPGLDDSFTREIRAEIPPKKFKIPSCESYDGTTDRFDHVQTYKMVMSLYGANDSIVCKAFPTTLRGAARSWYNGLPGNFVFSYHQFGALFTPQYVNNGSQKMTSEYMYEMRQKIDATIQTYIQKFNTEVT